MCNWATTPWTPWSSATSTSAWSSDAAVRHDVPPRLGLQPVLLAPARPAGPQAGRPVPRADQEGPLTWTATRSSPPPLPGGRRAHHRHHLHGEPAHVGHSRLLRRWPQLRASRTASRSAATTCPRRRSSASGARSRSSGTTASLLDRVPRGLARGAAARGRDAAQPGRYTMADQLAFRMRQRPVRTAAACSTVVVSILPAGPDGRRRRAGVAAPRPGQPGGQEPHHRRRGRSWCSTRQGRRHEGHDLGADRQGGPAPWPARR